MERVPLELGVHCSSGDRIEVREYDRRMGRPIGHWDWILQE
jgi:hypothetical protein